MNKRQSAKYKMYAMVVNFFNKRMGEVTVFPALAKSIQHFSDQYGELAELSMAETAKSQPLKGVKMEKKLQMADHFSEVAGVVHAFAVLTGNLELKANMNLTHSDLLRKGDGSLTATCTNICTALKNNIDGLADYGITPATLARLEEMNTGYERFSNSPRGRVATRSALIKRIAEQIKEMDSFLHNVLDKLMLHYKLNNSNVYFGYTICRSIVDPAHTTTCVKGTVTDETTGQPLEGVQVMVKNEENTYAITTTADGRCFLKVPQPGMYTLTYEKEGYTSPAPQRIQVTLGRRAKRDAVLKKEAEGSSLQEEKSRI